MKTNQMIQSNNELRKQLNPENAKFYGDLLIYVKSSGIFRDDHVIENKLLEILNDLIDAQLDGISANDYFGSDAKLIADNIVKEVPFNTKDFFKTMGVGMISYIFMSGISGISSPKIPIDLGSMLISGVYFSLIASLILKTLSYTVYKVHSVNSKIMNILYFLLICALITPGYLVLILLKTPIRFKIDNGFGLVIIGLIIMASIYIIIKIKDKDFVIPFFIYILITCLLGIFNRLPVIGSVLTNAHSSVGTFVNVGSLVIAWLAFFWAFKRNAKKINDRKEFDN